MGTLSAVIAVRDEEDMISNCLKRLDFVNEIIVLIDDRTTDSTEQIASNLGAKVIKANFTNFADFKNRAIAEAAGEWILIIDADERVSRQLASEIQEAIMTNFEGFKIKRRNYFYGELMHYGGWQEQPIRLIKKQFAHYVGNIHETFENAENTMKIGILENHLDHFSHRNIYSNLIKAINYIDIGTKNNSIKTSLPIKSSTLYWAVIKEFGRRFVYYQGWRDGVPGAIECILQPFTAALEQIRLWELQQSPSIDELYEQLEESTY